MKVATIATQDQEPAITVTVQLAPGSNDNAKFELVGADLRYIGPAIDYENASAQKQFTVMLQAKDAGGELSETWPVVVSVSDVDEAPPPPPKFVLTGTAGNDRISPARPNPGRFSRALEMTVFRGSADTTRLMVAPAPIPCMAARGTIPIP